MLLDQKAQTYKLLTEKLYERLKTLQLENERCVMRINAIKKITRKRARDSELLKRRLDRYQDNWRTIPMVTPHPKRKTEQKRGPKPKNKLPVGDELSNPSNKEKKPRRKRIKKNPHGSGESEPLVVAAYCAAVTAKTD